MRAALRSRSLREELRTPLARTVPEPPDEHGLVAPDPAEPTISRRGVLALVGGGSALVTAVTLGETLGDAPAPDRAAVAARPVVRRRAQRLPGQPHRPRPRRSSGRRRLAARAARRARPRSCSTAPSCSAMPQHTARLPIACVEGWSTVQTWSGVRLRDLVALAGVPDPSSGRRALAGGGRRVRLGDAVRRPADRPATRCSRCGSTASTCRPTTASPRASSCRPRPACTAPSGSARSSCARERAARRYGAGPLHLLAAAGVASRSPAPPRCRIAPDPLRLRYLAWFVGAVVAARPACCSRCTRCSTGPPGRWRGAVGRAARSTSCGCPRCCPGCCCCVFAPVVLQRVRAGVRHRERARPGRLPRPLAGHHRRAVPRLGAVLYALRRRRA